MRQVKQPYPVGCGPKWLTRLIDLWSIRKRPGQLQVQLQLTEPVLVNNGTFQSTGYNVMLRFLYKI